MKPSRRPKVAAQRCGHAVHVEARFVRVVHRPGSVQTEARFVRPGPLRPVRHDGAAVAERLELRSEETAVRTETRKEDDRRGRIHRSPASGHWPWASEKPGLPSKVFSGWKSATSNFSATFSSSFTAGICPRRPSIAGSFNSKRARQ